MSFGFSVSDIYGCARLAYLLYDEFKQAPGACQEFAHELLLFHQVLCKTESYIDFESRHLDHSDQAALSLCFDSCKELLYVQIMGAPMVPKDLEHINLGAPNRKTSFLFNPSTTSTDRDQFRFLALRQKFGERKFALRIPKLQRAVSAHVEKLTAFNVLIVQSCQTGFEASQERIEKRVGESHDLLVESSADRALQLDSLSDRLDASQTRIEAQLQAILETQQRSKAPILSQTLDASSPEGRQTWMEVGRLFRDEGITPAMIQKNRKLLVNAMKTVLKNEADIAESIPRSYVTAPEYPVDNSITSSVTQPRNASRLDLPSVSSPLSLLGSAPPRSAGFTDAFLERQHGATGSLDQKKNVDDGMQSLLRGMSSEKFSAVYKEDDVEYIVSEDVELENVDLKNVEQGLPNHSRERQRTMGFTPDFPASPTLRPENTTAKLEDEDKGVKFGASIENAIETIRSRVW